MQGKLSLHRFEVFFTDIDFLRIFWNAQLSQDAYKQLLAEGGITAKMVLSLWAYPELDDNYQLPKIKAMYTNDKNSRLRISAIKVYMDGLLQTRFVTLNLLYIQIVL